MVHKQLSETKNTLIVPLESGAYVPYEITSWGNIVNANPLYTFNEWRGGFFHCIALCHSKSVCIETLHHRASVEL